MNKPTCYSKVEALSLTNLFGDFLSRGAEVSDCGRYVVLAIREGCDPVNRLWYCDLKALPEGITGMYYDLTAAEKTK